MNKKHPSMKSTAQENGTRKNYGDKDCRFTLVRLFGGIFKPRFSFQLSISQLVGILSMQIVVL
jgi:hypothetical protein